MPTSNFQLETIERIQSLINTSAEGGNSFSNWNHAGKHLNETLQTILQSKIHVIACLRVKTEYVLQEEVNAKGKTVSVPKKVGLSPVMREGIDYEFTTMFEVGMDHNATTSKDRTGLFTDKTFLITERTGEQIALWLSGANPSIDDGETETDAFLQMIHAADNRDTLKEIGSKIKNSTLSEQQKEVIRNVYRERSNSLA